MNPLVLLVAVALFFVWRERKKTKAFNLAKPMIDDYNLLSDKILELFDNDPFMTEAKWTELLGPAKFADERRLHFSRKMNISIEFNSLESIVKKIIAGEGEIKRMR